ncbi:MAG: hypothetical protein GX935_06490 [Erysipelotrichia bacterium]|nr:hypothetical protein [Erysipelotrichia bacterium]
MNIKELLNIFTEDVINEIIAVDNGDGQYILSISDDNKDKNIQINVVLDEEVENAVNFNAFNINTYNYVMSYKTLSLITKIKSQWEDYISKNEHLDRMKKAYENNNTVEDKKLFVKNLGWLLSQTRNKVVDCEYVPEQELVIVTFVNGYEKAVNVECNSYSAIIRDVTKHCCG